VTFEEHLERWQALHGGVDPRATSLVVLWLRLVHLVARPLARVGAPPDALTLAAVLAAAAALVVPVWPAALLVVLSAFLDGLDGGVALLRDRVTARGALLDTLGDRASDLLFLAALVLAGAPWWLGIACGVGILLLEGLRDRANRVVTITVAERPTRVIATALGLVSIPTVGLAVLAAATAVGLLQLQRARSQAA
jgi:phosphatidylglycerophosphate synthase